MRYVNQKAFSACALITYCLQLLFVPTAQAAIVYSFTNAGATGRFGPTQIQVNSAYSASSLSGLVTVNTAGIQEWTVPTSAKYRIEIAGAAGGSNLKSSFTGGYGAKLITEVNLTSGSVLNIVVGQMGTNNPATCSVGYCGGSGGGGSFIYYKSNATYIAAAGGGGGGAAALANLTSTKSNADGKANSTSGTSITSSAGGCTSYTASGGTGGSGGSVSSRGMNYAGPGAGVNSNGGSASGAEGLSRVSNWVGGYMTITPTLEGGFGGGGAAGSTSSNSIYWAGGGGGYSGGGGGFNSGCSDGQYGGGGGSYYTGTLVSAVDGSNADHGYVKIQQVALPTVSISITGNALTANSNQAITLTATVDDTVKITFYADGKRIPNCIGLSGVAGTVTCNWKPTVKKTVSIYSVISQGGVEVARSTPIIVTAVKRTNTR